MTPASRALRPTRVIAEPGGLPAGVLPLSRVPAGTRCTVLAVVGPVRAELEREGLFPGRVILVTARTPLGGPIVVELGRARIALSVEVASHVSTTVAAPAAGQP